MASINLLEGSPKFVMTDLGNDVDGLIPGVRVDDRLQPIFTDGSRELSRLVWDGGFAVAALEDGSREVIGNGDGYLLKAPYMGGVAVFTETRIVAVAMIGEFFGGAKFRCVKKGDAMVVIEMAYEHIGAFTLEMKTKMLGGTKPIGFLIGFRNPLAGAWKMEVTGRTTLAKEGARVNDLPQRFETLATAIANHSRPYAYPEAVAVIDRFLARGAQRDEDGDLSALFEPDDWTGPAPKMQLRDVDAPVTEVAETTETAEATEGTRAAKFCGGCGGGFSGDEGFCTACGEKRRYK